MNNHTKPSIYILGGGVRGKKHLTLEAIKILKNSNCVLFFPYENDLEEWLIQKIGVEHTEDLSSEYLNGDIDKNNYERIVNVILQKGYDFEKVSVIIPGHPFIGVTWIKKLVLLDKNNVIDLKIVDGISSFDTILTDLSTDPLDQGTIIMDANRLLLFRLNVDPRINLIIYHVCSVGNPQTDFEDTGKNNQLLLLQKYLEKYYPSSHKLILIGSKSNSNASLKKELNLNNLSNIANEVTVDTSLFIPGIPVHYEDIDQEFYRLLSQK